MIDLKIEKKDLLLYAVTERSCLRGICLEEAVELIKRNSRHYAKRQFTWFRRYDRMKWLDLSTYDSEEEARGAMDSIIVNWLDD